MAHELLIQSSKVVKATWVVLLHSQPIFIRKGLVHQQMALSESPINNQKQKRKGNLVLVPTQ